MVKNWKNIVLMINLSLFLLCIAHITMNGFFILYPDLPEIKVYKTNLKNIDFPLAFKFCVKEIENSLDRYTRHGYASDYDFFWGRSMFNKSLFGWGGHLANGSSIADVKGRYVLFVSI